MHIVITHIYPTILIPLHTNIAIYLQKNCLSSVFDCVSKVLFNHCAHLQILLTYLLTILHCAPPLGGGNAAIRPSVCLTVPCPGTIAMHSRAMATALH